MINLTDFLSIVGSVGHPPNQEQASAIQRPVNEILQVVAGPGSGKTTVLLLRALRLVFVDDILPENILITTFTKKAARDIRSRWLDLGTSILNVVSQDHDTDHIDLNRCQTGTLDSITQQVLSEFRIPGQTAPTVMTKATSNLVLRRRAFATTYRNNQADIKALLGRYTLFGDEPSTQGQSLAVTRTLIDRLTQDRVDLTGYAQQGNAERLVVQMLADYKTRSSDTNVYDFTHLEEVLLERLNNGTVNDWTDQIRALFIDEYQDTNPLQEAIYFAIISASNPVTTIVGDDDQSLYRFRGGSVELFTDFAQRCLHTTGQHSRRVDIFRNYRSTPEIVDFYNGHIGGDIEFAPARINPAKSTVHAVNPPANVGVLGMFRQDATTLADDLAGFLTTLVTTRQFTILGGNSTINLAVDGDLGDIAFLAHTVREIQYDRFRGTQTELFPLHLRRALEANGLQVFNPRGQSLRDIHDIQSLLGLLLVIVDPTGQFTQGLQITNEARLYLSLWRQAAQDFIATNPAPQQNHGLSGFIADWQSSASGAQKDPAWEEWPALEIVYKLITWMPEFQNDAEHQVWMQALMEIIDSARIESPYQMMLHSNVTTAPASVHVQRSRESFIRDGLIPIAENNEDIDEDILPSVPRNRMQFMTIHQAKGLEFPFAIVDVGSRYTGNHWRQRFMRFPRDPSNVVRQEDDIEPHLPSVLRGHRAPIDRTFDDLTRLYYVAYSRPQSALMLVGNEKTLRYGSGTTGGSIPSVALGWNRDGTWPWRQSYSGRRPIKVTPPFTEI